MVVRNYYPWSNVDDPVIQHATEIKVEIKAAGVNPVDTKLRQGAYPYQ